MKHLLSAFAMAGCAVAVTAAQQSSAARPSAASSDTREVTVIGCLERVMTANRPSYRLTEVGIGRGEGRVATAMGAGVPAGETKPPLDAEAAKEQGITQGRYEISAESGVDLSEHVGKRIEVTGAVEDTRAAASASPDAPAAPGQASTNAASQSASNASANTPASQTIHVEKVREIASSCR